jgi:tetratricopeptide (TPR) repeat protein
MAISEGNTSFSNTTTLSTHVLVFLAFPLIGLLLYGHTLQAPFYLDDLINIRDRLYAISSLSLGEFFNASFESLAHRRPLANLSFALNYYFHGFRLPGYHLVNIVIHVTNGLLLYLLIFKTITLPGQRHTCRHPVWVAVLAGLLWFVNPIQIQSITYIVQRMNSMAVLFFLCSFLSYLYARLAEKRQTCIALLGLCALCWVFSMASKEIALTLPGLILVYEWFFFQNLERAWIKKSAVYVVTGFAGVLTAVYLVYHHTPFSFLTSIFQPRPYTALERFLTEGRVILLYISLLAYPHPGRLNLNHDIAISRSLLDPFTTLLSFVALLVLLVFTIQTAKRYRIVAFCMIWFFANVAIEALAADTEPMFEHRVYLPSMLFFVPFVWAAFRGINKPKIIVSVIAALLIVFSFWTYQRNALWNDPVAFWEDAARKSPEHFRSHTSLGISYMQTKAYDSALKPLQKALTLSPPYPTEIYANIGLAYLEIGKQDLARQNLERAVSLNPNNFVGLDLLGTLYRKKKGCSEAIRYYQRAMTINPNFAPSYYNLGTLYWERGDADSAVKMLTQALALRPMWSEAYSTLGLLRAEQGRYDLAEEALLKAVKINAKGHKALFNLAKVYDLTGRHEMAVRTYETLVGMNPEDVEAMHNLCIIYLKHLKNTEQATFYFRKALATDPEYDHAAIAKNILSQIAVKP